jgi:hypothetical protein
MPMYNLLFRNNGVLGNTGIQLMVNGTSATSLQVQARTAPSPPTPPGAWSDVSGATFTSLNGQSTPNNPSDGDRLGLPSTVLTVDSISGAGTFTQNGDGTNGPGYYTTLGPEKDEGDWCATAG